MKPLEALKELLERDLNLNDGYYLGLHDTYGCELFQVAIIKQALTELERLQKKHKLADDVLAYIGETLVDESKFHITKQKAINDIRKYTSVYHNTNWSDEK
jgi:hypothetical protein